jgi:hypothetical protein
MNRIAFCRVIVAVITLSALATTQTKPHPLPCDFSGELLHNDKNQPVWFTTDEMKNRATHKEDVDSVLKQMDISGTVIVDVLVNPSGRVACVMSLAGHPMIQGFVAKAVKQWTFKAANQNGHPVAYLGEMAFSLCNMLCGEAGSSMTLLK